MDQHTQIVVVALQRAIETGNPGELKKALHDVTTSPWYCNDGIVRSVVPEQYLKRIQVKISDIVSAAFDTQKQYMLGNTEAHAQANELLNERRRSMIRFIRNRHPHLEGGHGHE